MSNIPQAKSLRWLAIQFPYVEHPKDDTDRLCNAIHLYASAGADYIDHLQAKVSSLEGVPADNKYYVIYESLYDNDPLTCRGDYKRYVKSVLFDSSDGFDFFFTEDLDQALLCSFKNASYLVSRLRDDSPTASFEDVPGNE